MPSSNSNRRGLLDKISSKLHSNISPTPASKNTIPTTPTLPSNEDNFFKLAHSTNPRAFSATSSNTSRRNLATADENVRPSTTATFYHDSAPKRRPKPIPKNPSITPTFSLNEQNFRKLSFSEKTWNLKPTNSNTSRCTTLDEKARPATTSAFYQDSASKRKPSMWTNFSRRPPLRQRSETAPSPTTIISKSIPKTPSIKNFSHAFTPRTSLSTEVSRPSLQEHLFFTPPVSREEGKWECPYCEFCEAEFHINSGKKDERMMVEVEWERLEKGECPFCEGCWAVSHEWVEDEEAERRLLDLMNS